MTCRAFIPGATVNIVVAATSGRIALPVSSGLMQTRVANDGAATVWVAFGDSAVSAFTSTGTPVPAGTVEVFTVPSGSTHVAAIAAGATGTVYFTAGMGI